MVTDFLTDSEKAKLRERVKTMTPEEKLRLARALKQRADRFYTDREKPSIPDISPSGSLFRMLDNFRQPVIPINARDFLRPSVMPTTRMGPESIRQLSDPYQSPTIGQGNPPGDPARISSRPYSSTNWPEMKQSVQNVLGGIIHSFTLGSLPNDILPPDDPEAMAYKVGSFIGDLKMLTSLSKVVGKIPGLNKLPNVLGSITRGATTGAAYKTASEGVDVLKGREFDPVEIAKEAALFAAFDALPASYKVVKELVRQRKYAAAEAAYREITRGLPESEASKAATAWAGDILARLKANEGLLSRMKDDFVGAASRARSPEELARANNLTYQGFQEGYKSKPGYHNFRDDVTGGNISVRDLKDLQKEIIRVRGSNIVPESPQQVFSTMSPAERETINEVMPEYAPFSTHGETRVVSGIGGTKISSVKEGEGVISTNIFGRPTSPNRDLVVGSADVSVGGIKKLVDIGPKVKPSVPSEEVYLGFLGTNPQALAGLGEDLFRMLQYTGSRITPEFLKQAQNRFGTELGRKIVGEINSADVIHNRLVGVDVESLRKLGLYKMSADDAAKLADDLEAGSNDKFRSILDAVIARAKSVGIDIGYVKNYYPRVLKHEVAQMLYDDLAKLAEQLKATGGESDKALAAVYEKMGKGTQEILTHLMETGQAKNLREAINLSSREAMRQLFPRVSFEKTRTLDLPASVYDRDARRVLTKYVNDVNKRIAEARVWGADGAEAAQTLKQLSDENFKEGNLARQLIEMWTGQYDQIRGFKGSARKAIDAIVGFEFGGKIGLGTAVIPNITQPVISTIPDLGLSHFIRGGIKLMSPKYRSYLRTSGAINQSSLHAAMGYRPGGIMGKFADITSKWSGFDGINRLNLYTSAAAFDSASRWWYKAAKMENAYGRWARKRLADFGIDWKAAELSDDKVLDGMYRFATDSQLQKNFLKDPFFFNDPRLRPFVIFKRFGYRQATYIKDMMMREARRGNVLAPILRLAAGGYFGGEFVLWSKNKLKSLLSGEEVYRDSDQYTLSRLLSNVAAVGSIGVLGDVVIPTEYDESGYNVAAGKPNWYEKVAKAAGSSAEFALSPVVVNDFKVAMDRARRVGDDLFKYQDVGIVARRNADGVFDIVGSIPRWASKRIKTLQQKEDRLKGRRSDAIRKVLELYLAGDFDRGDRVRDLWNEKNPEYPIRAKDVSRREQVEKYKRDQETLDKVSQ